jgi:hypothetical protein
MACRTCNNSNERPPDYIYVLARKLARENGCFYVICKCGDWDLSEIDDFDFENKEAYEIITQ